MDLPLDGAISRYYREEAPPDVRRLLDSADKDDIANPRFPYPEQMKRHAYEEEMARLQAELVRFQAWVKDARARVLVVFEGRDAAGKGGSIKAFSENLNPRGARVVALAKPTEIEAGQWYFQRYIAELPTAGEIVLFDRSWYNRGIVEHVFGFCTPEERTHWFEQVGPFEDMLVNEGIHLFKFWLNVGRATQLERFLDRERDPLKQWKLSWIDAEGLAKWDDYSAAIAETLIRTHSARAPWRVLRADDKRRTRLNLIRSVLTPIDYAHKDARAIGALDPKIVGGPEVVTVGGGA
ncbi:polyphosphate kinase 2 [Rubellimicrobium aerolatum]|uniref:ADP/GDP-polyphosphate phosphotransferase n=1 Tax=Rubellimicrobium aerolatum TaxID=490979 RepID=A0ABW0S858_9RHOB|nr:polyphosphate kinase 2 [Rubellimicrobium aerolatum]MBP1804339.1 polyphosphate kinase 2 [Rubellimicrobium aerolatum]